MFQISAQVLPIQKCDVYDEGGILLSNNSEEDNSKTDRESFQGFSSSFTHFI